MVHGCNGILISLTETLLLNYMCGMASKILDEIIQAKDGEDSMIRLTGGMQNSDSHLTETESTMAFKKLKGDTM